MKYSWKGHKTQIKKKKKKKKSQHCNSLSDLSYTLNKSIFQPDSVSKTAGWVANSVDPDQMLQSVMSDQFTVCSSLYFLILRVNMVMLVRMIWVYTVSTGILAQILRQLWYLHDSQVYHSLIKVFITVSTLCVGTPLYHTDPKIWNSQVYYMLMSLTYYEGESISNQPIPLPMDRGHDFHALLQYVLYMGTKLYTYESFFNKILNVKHG